MGVARPRAGRRRLGLPAAAGGVALTVPVYSLRNVRREFAAGGTRFSLSVPQLDIHAGAKLAFVGESGSGKSTLLELLAMILRPSASDGFHFSPDPAHGVHDIAATWQRGDADAFAGLRARHIGYVLQSGGLLPYLSVRANIELSRRLLRLPLADSAQRWAEKLHIAPQLDKLPGELSVGQRQRAAIARALAHEPRVLIADEPTASIDPLNAERIMKLLTGLVDELGVTLILASHAHDLVRRSGLAMIEHTIDESAGDGMNVTVSGALH